MTTVVVATLALLAAVVVWTAAAAPPARTAAPVSSAVRGAARRPDALDAARMIERLATVLGSGMALGPAWDCVADSLPPGELAEACRRMAAGAPPRQAAGPALSRLPELDALHAALAVCRDTGAPAAPVLAGLAHALRDLHDAQRARGSAFAGPRSTARILLVLPLGGIALGMLLGVDPLGVLLGTPSGRILLALGLFLTVIGWWWMHRLLLSASGARRGGIDVSVVLELIAGPMLSGTPLAGAACAVGRAVDPAPQAERLRGFGEALQAGVPPDAAARRLGADLDPLREAALLAHRSGADLAQVLRSAAADARREISRGAEAAAARLAVRLVLPTGLALLPAFVILGIIPTVVSLLGGALAPGDLLGSPSP